jgi:hypothetical protein
MDFDTVVKAAGRYVYEAGFHPATTAQTIAIRNDDVTTEKGGVVSAGDVLAGCYIETFFAHAPAVYPNRACITGVVCGVRSEEIEDPLLQKIRI